VINGVRRYRIAAILAFLAAVFVLLWVVRRPSGEVPAFDSYVLLLLRRPDELSIPRGPHWLLDYFLNMTSLGSVTILATLTLLATAYLWSTGRSAAAAYAFVAAGGAWAVSNLLKALIGRTRPSLVPHLVEVHDASFPSGHATISMAAYLAFAILASTLDRRPRQGRFFLPVAATVSLIIGTSRVYLGVHYPSDVVAGWAIGAGWALLCWSIFARRVVARDLDGR
jgi:undecaprenyl-diphosphatase